MGQDMPYTEHLGEGLIVTHPYHPPPHLALQQEEREGREHRGKRRAEKRGAGRRKRGSGGRVRAEEEGGGSHCWNPHTVSTVWLSALGTALWLATSLTFLNCPHGEAFKHIEGRPTPRPTA